MGDRTAAGRSRCTAVSRTDGRYIAGLWTPRFAIALQGTADGRVRWRELRGEAMYASEADA